MSFLRNLPLRRVYLLVRKALKDMNLKACEDQIKKYGSLYETYDKFGSIKRVLYQSQPHFSEACGVYLDIVQEQISLALKW